MLSLFERTTIAVSEEEAAKYPAEAISTAADGGLLAETLAMLKYPSGKMSYLSAVAFLGVKVPAFLAQQRQAKAIPEVLSPKMLHAKCAKDKCYLLLLDGARSAAHRAEFVEVVRQASAAAEGRTFAWVDGRCQHEFLEGLGLTQDQLPTLVYLYAEAKRLVRIGERLNEDSARRFVERVERGKSELLPFDKLRIQSRECSAFHREQEEAVSGGKPMSEEEKEMIRELLERDEEKRQAAELLGKKKRRKKRV